MAELPPSLYDSEDYYADTSAGSRLSPMFDGLLRVFDRVRARSVLRKTGLSGRSGKVLDVGAGDGKFLHFMREAGFVPRGTTTSRRSARAAKSLFALDLDVSETLDRQLTAGPFDLLTYWHVFEHLEDPPAHERLWPVLVKPGGFVVIEVPNVRSRGARLCYPAWLGSDEKHHVNHQTPERITNRLRGLGFEPVRVESFSGKFSYVYLWSSLLGALFGRRYDFDGIMSILKSPGASLRRRPLWSLNALAAVGYLAPAIVGLMLYGVVAGEGEVFRVYARRQSTNEPRS